YAGAVSSDHWASLPACPSPPPAAATRARVVSTGTVATPAARRRLASRSISPSRIHVRSGSLPDSTGSTITALGVPSSSAVSVDSGADLCSHPTAHSPSTARAETARSGQARNHRLASPGRGSPPGDVHDVGSWAVPAG